MFRSYSPPARRLLTGALGAVLVVPLVAACAGSPEVGSSAKGDDDSPSPSSTPSPVSKVQVTANVSDTATNVPVSRMVRLTASDGTLRTVTVRTMKGEKVAGGMNTARTSWLATGRLEPGKKYAVHAVAADSSGLAKTFDTRFDSANLSLDQQTYPSVTPLNGQTVGVAMPVVIHFDVPVKNRKRFEERMHVTTSKGQKGTFHWMDSQTVHFRPQHYWKPNSKVNVAIDVNSVDAGNGVYGQEDRKVSFNVGRSMVSKVNAQTHQMKVFRDGRLLRTIPITTGMPGFTTRSGIKVIIEKDRRHDMNSETIGLDPNGPNGYNLKGVEYAMRLTFSGEFLHAAPWSVGSQGVANVSHGCTGMSTSNAAWLFGQSMIGDPVEYSGTDQQMTLTNGYGDWNDSWASWQAGSAL